MVVGYGLTESTATVSCTLPVGYDIGSVGVVLPGLEGQVQGIKMEEGGVASSVNMATLVYESWKQEGTKLILTGKSIGNGQTIEFVDTMDIKRLTADSLVLDNQGMEIRYAKQK
ncbi:hypothetical protein I6E77_21775 [Bacteroides thetaiotaomicron]|nr:hypothetical protein [Bacteroides thetaiotaomicron]